MHWQRWASPNVWFLRWQGHGVAKCIAVAGELGSRRITGAIGQAREAHAAGSDSHISSGNFYWRRPRATTKLPACWQPKRSIWRATSCVCGAVAGPTKRLEHLSGELLPWEPKKIYYFPDADREDIFSREGPEYSVKEIAKSSKQPYWRMALDSFRATRRKPVLS